jgi:hypothetical protein
MFTRKDYLNNTCSHSEYYRQFITDNTIKIVKQYLFKEIKKSKDKHFNDIPLKIWDTIPLCCKSLTPCGDYLTLAGKVCILKEAGRIIKNDK